MLLSTFPVRLSSFPAPRAATETISTRSILRNRTSVQRVYMWELRERDQDYSMADSRSKKRGGQPWIYQKAVRAIPPCTCILPSSVIGTASAYATFLFSFLTGSASLSLLLVLFKQSAQAITVVCWVILSLHHHAGVILSFVAILGCYDTPGPSAKARRLYRDQAGAAFVCGDERKGCLLEQSTVEWFLTSHRAFALSRDFSSLVFAVPRCARNEPFARLDGPVAPVQ